MRNLKKFLALVLAMMMTLSLMVTVNASSFKDDDDITKVYAEAIDVLTELGVVKGYGEDDPNEGKFLPKNNITRAEVAAIMYRIVTGDVNDANVHLYKYDSEFTDVNSDNWFAPYVNFCANNELVKGRGNGKFDPKANITGYEALVMILRAIGYNNPSEFTNPSTWRTKASGYGMKHGLTENIQEGSLGAFATREVVAEIMFKGLLAPMQNYSILTNYTTDLLVDASEVNEADPANPIYKNDIPNTLMYQTFGIIGKSNTLGVDAFGRPHVMWITDMDDDRVDDGTKYIENNTALGYTNTDPTEGPDEAEITLAMTPVEVYDNAKDECHMTKEINGDKSIYWAAITEVVNGEVLNSRDAGVAASGEADWADKLADATGKDAAGAPAVLDALHTTTKWVGATGRTLEIYKIGKVVLGDGTTGLLGSNNKGLTVDQWIFVYIDTFLGEVTGTTEAVKDSAGHTIIKATATVELGNKIANSTGTANTTLNDAAGNDTKDKFPAKLTVLNPDGKYKKGDLVLIQTSNAGESAFIAAAGVNPVSVPEKAPLYPTDVPNTLAKFLPNADEIHGSILLDEDFETVKNVTIKATVGQQDAKMGVIASDGTIYMASNTFLAARQAPDTTKSVGDAGTTVNNTVLADWYDVPNGDGSNAAKDSAALAQLNRGIVNAMIGRTYDIVLDHHGYIIGMKEVVNISDGVGVITGLDSARVGSGKYVSEVEAFMTDGTTKTFQLLGPNATAAGNNVSLDDMTDGDYAYFATMSAVDDAWAATNKAFYSDPAGDQSVRLGLGSLVQFKSISFDGQTYYKLVDWDQSTGTIAMVQGDSVATGKADDDGVVATGVTDTLVGGDTRMLDSKSTVFVAEYEYRYNTSGNNDGSNINKTYKVYDGFKAMPSIKGGTANVLYQQLGRQTGNDKYVLVYAKDTTDEYIIKNQDTITVDESYLVLSRGATYAEYSEYNVLKNGVETTLQVSNANVALNALIESTMDATVNDVNGDNHLNELLVVTGRNAKGYVTSVSTVTTLVAATNTTAIDNTADRTDAEIILAWNSTTAATKKVSHKNDLLAERDDVTGTETVKYLTLADNVKVQLVNRDQKSVSDVSMDVAVIYANGSGTMTAKNMVFELDQYGYVCNLYVIE